MSVKRKMEWPARIVVAILYGVGIVGFSLPATQSLFSLLSPWNLLLSFFVLLYFHENWSVKTTLSLVAIAVTGFLAELLGTQTGLLFGNYTYGEVLGLKFWETPLLIGVNWLVLCYGLYLLLLRFQLGWWLTLIGAFLMVLFDFVMEPVAVRFGMWTWENGSIPVKNYIDWFLLSFLLLSGMKTLRLNFRNPLAVWIIVCQFAFFLALNFKLNLP